MSRYKDRTESGPEAEPWHRATSVVYTKPGAEPVTP